MNFKLTIILKFSLIFSCLAQDYIPIREPSLLIKPIETDVVSVPETKVVLADYLLIKKDFPELAHLSTNEIDSWLIKNAGKISKTQTLPNSVNTEIQYSDQTQVHKSYRPYTYGRGLVFEVPGGLIDAKGAGAIAPNLGSHSNGLASLAESIREYLFSKLVYKVIKHSKAELKIIDTYAILDYGFDLKNTLSTEAAGLILRQAHTRYDLHQESRLPFENCLNIEKIFRPYGLTSVGMRKSHISGDILNIQGTKDLSAIIDFGAYRVTDKPFTRDIYKQSFQYLSQEEAGILNITPELKLPSEDWATPDFDLSSKEIPYLKSKDWSEKWRARSIDRSTIENEVNALLKKVDDHLKSKKPIYSSPLQCVLAAKHAS